jgi:hypothetical protein
MRFEIRIYAFFRGVKSNLVTALHNNPYWITLHPPHGAEALTVAQLLKKPHTSHATGRLWILF